MRRYISAVYTTNMATIATNIAAVAVIRRDLDCQSRSRPRKSDLVFANLPKSFCELAENVGGLNWSMQHHLIEMISFRGGVDETRETVWAFCGAADRHLEPLEGWRVVA
jgi:hypothetical protein